MTQPSDLWRKVQTGQRLSPEDALYLFEKSELLEVGQWANKTNQNLNGNIIGYVVDRNLNYTNICVLRCKFCAFRRDKHDKDAWELSLEEVDQKIQELINHGGTQILMQGGHHPEFKLAYYTELLAHIKSKFPKITIHAFSPPELHHIARLNKMTYFDLLSELKNAGLNSIPGGGAEILDDKIRQKISAGKCSSKQWLDVFETAHKLGLQGSATMMFGHHETYAHRVAHLQKLRELQDRTGGFFAFIPWTYVPGNSPMGGKQVGSHDYLKTLAISRLFLDNFKNIQISWLTQGLKVAQIATQFGGNDMGSTLLEENVVRATGAGTRTNAEELRHLINELGKEPKQRDTFYQYLN